MDIIEDVLILLPRISEPILSYRSMLSNSVIPFVSPYPLLRLPLAPDLPLRLLQVLMCVSRACEALEPDAALCLPLVSAVTDCMRHPAGTRWATDSGTGQGGRGMDWR